MKALIAIAAMLGASFSYAGPCKIGDHAPSHSEHAMHAPAGHVSPATQEYIDGMQSMHEGMMQGIMASNPDEAFARGMMAHHIGAVEMAKTQLKYGKDPEMRKLAEDIIKAQQPEIDQMQAWINKHGKPMQH